VANDNQVFLEMLTSLLAVEFDVVASAEDGKSAPELVPRVSSECCDSTPLTDSTDALYRAPERSGWLLCGR